MTMAPSAVDTRGARRMTSRACSCARRTPSPRRRVCDDPREVSPRRSASRRRRRADLDLARPVATTRAVVVVVLGVSSSLTPSGLFGCFPAASRTSSRSFSSSGSPTASLCPLPDPRAPIERPVLRLHQTLPCDDYPTYERTESGLLYKEVRFGEGAKVETGKEVVVDWDGYTFYLSHVVQARNLPKGGDFTGENPDAFLRFTPGGDVPSVIPAFEECVKGMRVGGIRRIIVRPGPLSYPGSLTRRGGRFDEESDRCRARCPGRRRWSLSETITWTRASSWRGGDRGDWGRDQRGLGRGPGRWADSVKGSLT